MDPVKKEAPIPTAVSPDQTLVDKTGGIPGVDHSGQVDVTRKAVAVNLGIPQNNVIPEAELAERELGETEKADFLKDVAGVQEAGDLKKKDEPPSSSLDLNEWKQNIGAHLPQIGEDTSGNDREMPSGDADEINRRRLEKMKKAA